MPAKIQTRAGSATSAQGTRSAFGGFMKEGRMNRTMQTMPTEEESGDECRRHPLKSLKVASGIENFPQESKTTWFP